MSGLPASPRPHPPEGDGELGSMTEEEVRSRTRVAVAMVVSRGFAARAMSLVGTIVLARLLVPEDFGLVALGIAVTQFGQLLASGGIGPALIRRADGPSIGELRALLGLQLVISVLFGAATIGLALMLGEGAMVTAVIVASMPLWAFRTPAALQLERKLAYRPLAVVEISEVACYYAWAIATVAAGWGVWGLASASIIQAGVGSLLVVRAVQLRIVRPSFHVALLRPLLGFGIRYQAVNVVDLTRQQALTFGTAAIAGLGPLGLWHFAFRILRVPHLLFTSLWRVAYPAMSRYLETGQSPRPIMERVVGLAVAAAGAMFVFLIASSPALVPAFFGEAWEPVLPVLPPAALGLLLAGPVTGAAAGYLYAAGAPTVPLKNAIARNAVWLATAISLIEWLGVAALGLGWLAASLVSITTFSRAVRKRTGARLLRPLVIPATLAVIATATGWLICERGEPTVLTGLLGGACAECLFLGGMLLLRREVLMSVVRLAHTSFRDAIFARA